MNDIDFAKGIDPGIGRLYEQAKAHARSSPGYALSLLRGVASLLCDTFASSSDISLPTVDDLSSKIRLLAQKGVVGKAVENSLHRLRKNGNKGAHPEEFNLGEAEFVALADESIAAARDLLGAVFQVLHPEAPLPPYDVIEVASSLLPTTCYRAVMEADAEARYFLGKYFQNRVVEIKKGQVDEARKSGYSLPNFDISRLNEQAYFWFKLASEQSHAPSMFEYGFALADGLDGEDKKALGEHTVYRAAKQGDADANTVIGNWLLDGSIVFEKDPVEARAHFEQAADKDHPGALATLGALYANGIGGPANAEAAFECTRKSAEAGYPEAQFNLYVLFANGQGTPKDDKVALDWLVKAADQNFPAAMLTLARLAISGQAKGYGIDDAETLLDRCVPHSPEAAYDLAQLCQQRSEMKDLLKAATLLQHCYERVGRDTNVGQRCWEESPKLVRRIKTAMPSQLSDDELAGTLMILNLFDDDGHPYKSRKERVSNFAKKLNAFRDAKSPVEKTQAIDKLIPGGIPRPPPRDLPIKQIPKVGRNAPCPCGSGRKHKVCCGK